MSRMTIGILGGSGFVGGVLANRLVAGGHRVRIFTRARSHAREVWLLPDTEVIELDPREQEQYNHGFAGLDAVVNLVGILNERGNVLGMMPHPERACEPLLGNEDGNAIWRSVLQSVGVAV